MLNFAKNFFIENISNYELSDIKKIKKIDIGYSNNNFYLETFDNKKFFIRIVKNNKFINRGNEIKYFSKAINYKPLFIDFDGNMISNWINNFSNLENPNKLEIILIIEKILSISKLEINDLDIFDYYKYFEKNNRISDFIFNKYKSTIRKYQNEKLFFAHNDLNISNIYFDNKIIEFVDWEWCSMNNNYWDIAYFLKDLILSEELIFSISEKFFLSIDKIYDFLFITTTYAISWINYYEIKDMDKYYKHLNSVLNFVSKKN